VEAKSKHGLDAKSRLGLKLKLLFDFHVTEQHFAGRRHVFYGQASVK
jgi:hypothetical protein